MFNFRKETRVLHCCAKLWKHFQDTSSARQKIRGNFVIHGFLLHAVGPLGRIDTDFEHDWKTSFSGFFFFFGFFRRIAVEKRRLWNPVFSAGKNGRNLRRKNKRHSRLIPDGQRLPTRNICLRERSGGETADSKCRARTGLQNALFVSNVRSDTAENEPSGIAYFSAISMN